MKVIEDDVWAWLTIWQEARGESAEGRIGVAESIWNRMKLRYQSDGTVAGTVLRPYQFSGWNTRDPNRLRSVTLDDNDIILMLCKDAWQRAKEGSRVTKGAVHYYNPHVVIQPPDWTSNCIQTVTIGKHAFYKLI